MTPCFSVCVSLGEDVMGFLYSSGEGGQLREHKTSFHAIAKVIRSEGFLGIYNG